MSLTQNLYTSQRRKMWATSYITDPLSLACVRHHHFGSVTITFYSLKFSKKNIWVVIYLFKNKWKKFEIDYDSKLFF